MRFCSLGSGSRGNAYVVEGGGATILIDCGFSGVSLRRRLSEAFLTLAEIDAILITHEHHDHVCGLGTLLRDGPPVYMTAGTKRMLTHDLENWHLITPGRVLTFSSLQIMPVPVPHDAAEPVQFVFDDGGRRLGLFTDLGYVTPVVKSACAGVDAIVAECNYCDDMLLENRRYPARVKSRIAGKYGHLENRAAAAFIESVGTSNLRHIVAAHLSEHNNSPELVKNVLSEVCDSRKITVAAQAAITNWLVL